MIMPRGIPTLRQTLRALRIGLMTFLLVGCGAVIPVAQEYQPTLAQQGKDVVWIPTPTDLAERLLKAAKVTPQDLVYDLGAGDGKIAILAAKQFNATAVGVEFNPDMAEHARKNAQRAGVTDKVTIITGDIFKEDFSKATVVTLYLLPSLNIKLRPTLLAMKPGTRIVSNTFTMGLWTADQTIETGSGHLGYLWIVPANADGYWSLSGLPDHSSGTDSGTGTLIIRQQYQELNGTLQISGTKSELPVKGRMNGDEITFNFRDANGLPETFIGKIENGTLKGYLKSAPSVLISGRKSS